MSAKPRMPRQLEGSSWLSRTLQQASRTPFAVGGWLLGAESVRQGGREGQGSRGRETDVRTEGGPHYRCWGHGVSGGTGTAAARAVRLRPPHLHVAFSHHDFTCKLHQLVQGLRVNVVQCHVCLTALTHLAWVGSRWDSESGWGPRQESCRAPQHLDGMGCTCL